MNLTWCSDLRRRSCSSAGRLSRTTPRTTPKPGLYTSALPSRTGSRSKSTPNRSRTPSRTRRSSRRMSAQVAPPRFVNASECLVEMPAAPSRNPFANPARSISHAADSFTRPSVAGYTGTRRLSIPAASATRGTLSAADHRVLEVRPRALGVRVARDDHHPLAVAYLAHRPRATSASVGVPSRPAKYRCTSA